MNEIKPKKERRFLKTLGRVGEILVEQVLIKLGSSIIKKIGGKKTLPSILFLLASLSLFAQFPNTGNKQRLGFQTTGDGLVWRGALSDTASIQPINNQNAWVILDTINLKFYTFDFTSNVWNLVGGGGSAFTQPVDSLFFNVGVPTNNVDTAKMRWDSDLATVVLGLNDNVPNELGFKNFWLVKNQTGSTITKGSLVYANGTVGASGRITVDKFIANGSIDAKYLLGITAHDLTDGEDGYVISFGKIRQVNTDTFAAGAILYPSPTVAGFWTDVEPVAPNIDMPIGFCINSSSNNGTIAIRVASGYKLSELHDLAISSPVEKSSLYYSNGLWRDTTAALLVSDTASMLTNYLRTGVAASTYLTQSNAASTYLPLAGGTLTGGLNGTTGTFTGLNINNTTTEGIFTLQGYDNNTATRIQFNTTGNIRRQIILPTSDSNLEFRTSTIGGTQGGYSFYTRRNPNPSEFLAFNIDLDGNSNFYGTLGVTGATTLTGGINGNIKTNGAAGPTSTPDNIWLGNSYSNGTTRDKLKIYLYNDNTEKYGFSVGSAGDVQYHSNSFHDFYIANTKKFFISNTNTTTDNIFTVNNAAVFNEGSTDSDFRVESDGNANMVFVDASTDRVGIGYASPTKTLDVNGEVRINTVTATPTSLLGKDGSNVVGDVTDINQSGVMKVGGTTATTNAVGNINVAHGLSYTPSKVIATIAQLNSYVIVVRGITSSNLEFTIYDSTTGVGLNSVSVGFFWIAFK